MTGKGRIAEKVWVAYLTKVVIIFWNTIGLVPSKSEQIEFTLTVPKLTVPEIFRRMQSQIFLVSLSK